MGYPIAGDPVYGGRKALKQLARPAAHLMQAVSRQMLHAWRMEVSHPVSEQVMHLEAPVADDMQSILESLDSIQAGHP